jgi:hypothetical protein
MNLKTLSKKKFAVVSKRRSQNISIKKLAMQLMPTIGGSHATDLLGRENVSASQSVRRKNTSRIV